MNQVPIPGWEGLISLVNSQQLTSGANDGCDDGDDDDDEEEEETVTR